MNSNTEIEEIIKGVRTIKGFENKEEDDCLQGFEDVEWLDLYCSDLDE